VETYLDGHVLSWVIALPGVTALVLLATGAVLSGLMELSGLRGEAWRAIGLVASVATFGIACMGVLGGFDPERFGLQLVEHAPWIPSAGIAWFVGVDGISLFLVVLVTGLVPLVLLASWRQIDRSLRSFVFHLLVLETGLLLVLLAQDAVLFFLGWQATLLPMYFLIGIWGGSRRVRAATRFLVVSGVGSALLLVAILALGTVVHGAAAPGFALATPPGASAAGLLDAAMPATAGFGAQGWLFLAFVLAFGLAIPIVPLHAWLPDAHSEAPPAVTALLAAVGVKMGAYGLLRFALPLCPDAALAFAPALSALALAGILYGAWLATVQRDLERLVAWWTIAQLGFVLLGLFSAEVHGVTGAVIAMVSHGLVVAALLFLIGSIAERRDSTEIGAFGGLARPMPVFAALLALVAMSAMGVPLLSGFVGDGLVVLAGFGLTPWVGLLATGGWVMSALAWGWAYRRVALGPVHNPENRGLIDLDWRERAVVLVLLVPIVWIGVSPGPVLRRVEPAVLELMRQMDDRRTGTLAVPPAEGRAGEPGAAASASTPGAPA
jgi:NADH-quinone oxidoreductase subunit M